MISLLTRLIQAVEAAGLDCDGRDLADTLWLAARLPPGDHTRDALPEAVAATEKPPTPPVQEPAAAAKEGGQAAGETAGATADLHLPGGAALGAGTVAGRPARTPAADALPGRLALARALRPLMRRVPSRTVRILDEDATVECIAGGEVWTPQLRPALERRFRVTLVVDDSRSMAVWRRTAHELHVLLRWIGAFRDLRLVRMNGDTGSGPRSIGIGGEHLVLVLSDCVSAAWWDGRAFRQLEQWGQSASVCLLQALPESLWARTALRHAQGVDLRRRGSASASSRLEAAPLDPWLTPAVPEGLRLPVATLQPGGLGALARLLADPAGGRSRGLVVRQDMEAPAGAGTTEIPAAERVWTFKRLASPLALRLARLVAVAGVISLQVIRLIRAAMLREASQVHEAEVLLGGLLYALRDPGADLAQTNDIYFRFHDGVADLLLDGLPIPDGIEVLAKVSEYAERHWGAPHGFRAILADPTAAPATEISAHPFVRLAAARLERLGGEYARLARRLSEPARSTLSSAPQKAELAEGRTDEHAGSGVAPVDEPGSGPDTLSESRSESTSKGRIFISYRGVDGLYDANFILANLIRHFGQSSVLMDIDSIRSGINFRENLDQAVRACEVMLVIIGAQWLEVRYPDGPRKGQRMLDDPEDYVRREIESALQRDIPVIPVLIDRAHMPTAHDLPDELKPLADRQAVEVRPGMYFHRDVENLIPRIELLFEQFEKRQPGDVAVRSQIEARQPGDIMSISLGEGLDMKFAWCPPGTFLMGSPGGEAERSDNETQHRVTLTKGFWMGVTQVTQAQWQAVMGSNPSHFRGEDRPVEQVSWDDCQDFCRLLCERTGKVFRLPTEAEWEYACRAGTPTPFFFGETIAPEQVNYNGNFPHGQGKKGTYRRETTPVGSFPANSWGLYDMHGNIWEWCADWFGPYPSSNQKDPIGRKKSDARVLRGGSWHFGAHGSRSAYRGWDVPYARNYLLGCRLVLCLD